MHSGTPLWIALLLVIVLTRTHLPMVAVGWLLGSVVRIPLQEWYPTAGAFVLQAAPELWQLVAQLPIVCYFTLERARVMGSLVCGAGAGALIAFVVTLTLCAVQRRCPREVSV